MICRGGNEKRMKIQTKNISQQALPSSVTGELQK
jgi:hypothetical protein